MVKTTIFQLEIQINQMHAAYQYIHMLPDGFPMENFCFGFLFFGDILRVDGVMNEINLQPRFKVNQVDVGVGVEVDYVDLVGMLVRLVLLFAFRWIR